MVVLAVSAEIFIRQVAAVDGAVRPMNFAFATLLEKRLQLGP